MVCTQYNSGKCNARANLKNGVFVPPVTPHTCGDPNFNLEEKIQFRQALRQGMKQNRSAKQVHLQESAK